jgi:hypothetical protein
MCDRQVDMTSQSRTLPGATSATPNLTGRKLSCDSVPSKHPLPINLKLVLYLNIFTYSTNLNAVFLLHLTGFVNPTYVGEWL